MSICITLARLSLIVTLSHAAAMAQVNSPVGAWKSSSMLLRDYNVPFTVQLMVDAIDAEQRAAGRFVLQLGVAGGFPTYCRTGPVSGRYEGAALVVKSEASNLCSERVFDLKFDGTTMAGTYRGSDGNPLAVTFTRQ